MRKPLRTALFLAVLLTCTSVANAQDSRAYVGGAFTLSAPGPDDVKRGTPNLTFINTSDDGPPLGVLGEAGLLLNRRIGIGVEVGQTFRSDLTSRHFYSNPYLKVSRYRERTIFGVVSYQPESGRLRIGLVAGGGLIQENALQRTAQGQPVGSDVFGPLGVETEVSDWVWGAMFGVDTIIDVARHVSIVPQIRLVTAARGDVRIIGDLASIGLPSFAARAGIGIRSSF